MSSSAEQFMKLPRAFRWLLAALLFVVLFRAWDSSLGGIARGWNTETDAILANARKIDSANIALRIRLLEDAIVGMGPVERPDRVADGTNALGTAVAAVLGKRKHDFDQNNSQDRLREDISRGIVTPGNRLVRLTGTLKFQASPEEAIAIIAELEDRKEIEAIRKVFMSKADSRGQRQVNINLTLEAWVQAPATTRRGS